MCAETIFCQKEDYWSGQMHATKPHFVKVKIIGLGKCMRRNHILLKRRLLGWAMHAMKPYFVKEKIIGLGKYMQRNHILSKRRLLVWASACYETIFCQREDYWSEQVRAPKPYFVKKKYNLIFFNAPFPSYKNYHAASLFS